jgi:sigma54-dependent transcription regulator
MRRRALIVGLPLLENWLAVTLTKAARGGRMGSAETSREANDEDAIVELEALRMAPGSGKNACHCTGSRPIRANLRVIAAITRNLADDLEYKRFRADLYFRLNAYRVQLPLARDRPADIPLFCEYLLERFASRNQAPVTGLAAGAKAALPSYDYPGDYPGNVRELEHQTNKLAEAWHTTASAL